jgi:hypothetical protein
MLITIVSADEYMPASKDAPIVGRIYALEPADTGSIQQGRAFHALIQEYWRSGLHSYDAKTFLDFRNMIKRDLGAGFESFAYVIVDNGRPIIRDAKTMDDVPASIRMAPRRKDLIRGRLKSWGDYTKKERRESIDRVIAEMIQAGVNSKKFDEILEGLRRGNDVPV